MYRYVKKVTEDENEIHYEYGFNTKELSGKIQYNKHDEELFFKLLAKEDSFLDAKDFLSLISDIIRSKDPDEVTIEI